MDVSFIIVNYHTAKLVYECVSTILNYCVKNSFEIIVIDNGSQDKELDSVRNFSDAITVITNTENKGFGHANNQGAVKAKGKYLFFINADTLFTSDTVSILFSFAEAHKNVGVIAPQLLVEKGIEQEYAYGKYPTITNTIWGKFTKRLEPRLIFETGWVSGAAFLISRELFSKVGGFDENYFMYFEDIDLCKRLKDMGYSCIVDKETNLVHLGGRAITLSKVRKKYYYVSQDYFFKKHYGAMQTILMKICRLPLQIVRYIHD